MPAASDALATQETLDPEAMWRTMRHLLDRLFGVLESDDVLDDSLDILVEVLGADRGLILLTNADGSAQANGSSISNLPTGTNYQWYVGVQDSNGNSSQEATSYDIP